MWRLWSRRRSMRPDNVVICLMTSWADLHGDPCTTIVLCNGLCRYKFYLTKLLFFVRIYKEASYPCMWQIQDFLWRGGSGADGICRRILITPFNRRKILIIKKISIDRARGGLAASAGFAIARHKIIITWKYWICRWGGRMPPRPWIRHCTRVINSGLRSAQNSMCL